MNHDVPVSFAQVMTAAASSDSKAVITPVTAGNQFDPIEKELRSVDFDGVETISLEMTTDWKQLRGTLK